MQKRNPYESQKGTVEESCLIWLPLSSNCITLNINKLHQTWGGNCNSNKFIVRKQFQSENNGTGLTQSPYTTAIIITYNSDSQTLSLQKLLPWKNWNTKHQPVHYLYMLPTSRQLGLSPLLHNAAHIISLWKEKELSKLHSIHRTHCHPPQFIAIFPYKIVRHRPGDEKSNV